MKRPLVLPSTEQEDKDFQDLITFFNETLGFCPNSVKTMYHRPSIAYAFIELNKAVMENKGNVTSSLKRLIGYISSNADFRTHDAFSEAEKAVLEFTLASSIIPNSVDDKIAENLRLHWNDGEIVEILGVIALFGYLNRWNDSMGTELEKDAIASGEKYLKQKDWTPGKHKY